MRSGLSRPGDTERGLRLLGEALRDPFTIAGRRLHMAASVGVALYPDDGKDAEALLRVADSDMYAAKKTTDSADESGIRRQLRPSETLENPGCRLPPA